MIQNILKKNWVAWAVLVIGSLLTIVAAFEVHTVKKTTESVAFTTTRNEVKNKILERLSHQKQVVHNAVGLFESIDSVRRKDWTDFVQSLDDDQDLKGVEYVGFTQYIHKDKLGEHVVGEPMEGSNKYTVTPQHNLDIISEIVYVEPISGKKITEFGYDMFTNDTCRAAMERARDSHKVSITGLVIAAHDSIYSNQRRIMMFAPVYKRGLPKRTVHDRQTALQGWVFCTINLNDLLQENIHNWNSTLQQKIGLTIYDTHSQQSILFEKIIGDTALDRKIGESVSIPAEVFGRRWMIVFNNYNINGIYKEVVVVTLSGFIICFLLFALLRSSMTMHTTALQIAGKLTHDLKESEKRLQDVIIGTNAGTWEWNIQTGETVFNERWAEIIGYSLDELNSISKDLWLNLAHPDDLAESKKLLEKHFSGELPYYSFDSRLKHKDGTWVWVLDRGKITEWDSEGKPLRMSGTHTDITARKRMEEKLRESEGRLRVILDTLTEGVALNELIFNEKGEMVDVRILEVNQAFYSTADYNKDVKVIGALASEIYGISSEEMKQFWSHHIYASKIVIREIISPLNQKVFSLSTSPFKNNRYVTTFSDITEFKLVEDKIAMLSKAVEQIPVSIMITDLAGTIQFVNKKFTEVTGYTSAEVINRNPRILNTGAQSQEYYAELFQTILSGKEWHGVFHNKKSSGELYWASQVISPIVDHEGKIYSFLSIMEDISERKEAINELNIANERLQKLNAEKDKFFSIIAHDLRSPFSGFLGLTKIMAEDLLTMPISEIMEMAQMMQKSADTMYKLLENLLEWSRMERGITPFNPELYEFNGIAEQNIALVTSSCEKKNIRIVNNLTPGISVWCDIPMINSVLRNLLSNAIKFTKKGGEVTLTSFEDEQEVVISVHDNGIGMDPVTLSKLFRLDEIVSRPGTEGEPSTGLGLLLCKEFIVKHDGRIWAESEAETGTTFYFSLPKKSMVSEVNHTNLEQNETV
ncbi:MAG: PAS domain S-box protein [Ignavibacteria bacterium]|nr:PAS domain S-box protein [Ignavibacteria bacterium]